MYSIVLMAAMTSSPAQPQGIFFNRGGCNGTRATPVRTVIGAAVGVVRGTAKAVKEKAQAFNESRPHVFRSSGCSGSTFAVTNCGACATFTERTITRTRTVVRGGVGCTACPSGACPAPAGYQAMPQPEVGFGQRIEWMAVHRQLRVALRRGNLSPEDKAAAEKLLAHPLAYDAAVSKIHSQLLTQVAKGNIKLPPASMPTYDSVGKIGDGTILKLLLDNLPQIMAAVMAILKAFHIGAINYNEFMQYMCMFQPYFDELHRQIIAFTA